MDEIEELIRAYEERETLETDISIMEYDELRQYEEGSEDYEALEAEINAMQNQVLYLNSVIDDLETRVSLPKMNNYDETY